MTLTHIAAFTVAGIVLGSIRSYRLRSNLILITSLVAMYWLQPATSIRYLEFWLPTVLLGLIVVVYLACFPDEFVTRENMFGVGLTIGIPLAIGLLRYLGPLCCVTSSIPPRFIYVLGWVILLVILAGIIYITKETKLALIISFIVALLIFVIIKNEFLSELASKGLRTIFDQDPNLASGSDLIWFGYSYSAFRLLHVIRDKQNNRLPGMTLVEFVSYLLFFPSFTAGPIDRVEKFIDKLRNNLLMNSARFITGSERLMSGLFKKFVLADTLALVSLSPQNASQINVTFLGWVALYAYAFRILLDFSGYTDIAIGIGIFAGIQLPENFNKPYLQRNLTEFWNNWHMTLTQWFRAYFFNPFTRALRSTKRKISFPLIIFSGQLFTMVLIGLWHAIAWNFVIWGIWHGLGLFIHNRWSSFVRAKGILDGTGRPWIGGLGVLLNFNFVALGWIWFVIPDVGSGWRFFILLFGGG